MFFAWIISHCLLVINVYACPCLSMLMGLCNLHRSIGLSRPLFYLTPVTQLKQCEWSFFPHQHRSKSTCEAPYGTREAEWVLAIMSAEKILALDADKWTLMSSSWDTDLKKVSEFFFFFSMGFGVADWLLCQPVRANISAVLLPTGVFDKICGELLFKTAVFLLC